MLGAIHVDDMFQQYFMDLLGDKEFRLWQMQHPDLFSKIKYKAWEDAKKCFDGSKPASIDLSYRVITSLPDDVSQPSSPQ